MLAGLRHVEPGVGHAERPQHALGQHLRQRLPGDPGHQHAEHIGAGVVQPLVSGLVGQRQAAEPLHPLVRLDRRAGGTWCQAGLLQRSLDRVLARRRHDRAQAPHERQQVAHGDRPVRRDRVVQRRVDPGQDLAAGQFRQQAVHRVVQPQPAFLHQGHGRRGRDLLGDRRDTEDRVPVHRLAPARLEGADRLHVHLAAAGHHRDQAGHAAGFDVPRQHLQPPQPRRGQT